MVILINILTIELFNKIIFFYCNNLFFKDFGITEPEMQEMTINDMKDLVNVFNSSKLEASGDVSMNEEVIDNFHSINFYLVLIF